jgi:hypothetical protein
MSVLKPVMRMFYFLPRREAAQEDAGVAEGACLLAAGEEHAPTRGES